MQQQSIKKQDGLACKLTLQEIKQRFKDNDLVSVGTRTNAAGVGFFSYIYMLFLEMNSYSVKLTTGSLALVDAILDTAGCLLRLNLGAQDQVLLQLLHQAIGFILQ